MRKQGQFISIINWGSDRGWESSKAQNLMQDKNLQITQNPHEQGGPFQDFNIFLKVLKSKHFFMSRGRAFQRDDPLYEIEFRSYFDLEGFESWPLELSRRLYGIFFLINISFTIPGPRLLIDLNTKLFLTLIHTTGLRQRKVIVPYRMTHNRCNYAQTSLLNFLHFTGIRDITSMPNKY